MGGSPELEVGAQIADFSPSATLSPLFSEMYLYRHFNMTLLRRRHQAICGDPSSPHPHHRILRKYKASSHNALRESVGSRGYGAVSCHHGRFAVADDSPDLKTMTMSGSSVRLLSPILPSMCTLLAMATHKGLEVKKAHTREIE
jgi:hypothetical protein